ncbi:MAG: glycosyltransferase [Candidatus Nanopelagicales bacterium]
MDSSDPTVSAVIPCHDNFAQLGRTLAALSVQTAEPEAFEVIVVDNNSKQAGLDDVVARFGETLSITLVHQPRLPHPFALCRARNLAISLARSAWIWTLDSDCCPNPGAVAAILDTAGESDRALMMTGERLFVDTSDVSIEDILESSDALTDAPPVASPSNYHLNRDRRFPAVEALPDLPHPWDMMHGGNTAFRRADAVAVGGYDEAFDGNWGYEDDEFAYRMITRAHAEPVFVPGMAVYHQESAAAPDIGRISEEADRTAMIVDRPNKADNPNWHRVCALIPGYREYKLAAFSAHGVDVTI